MKRFGVNPWQIRVWWEDGIIGGTKAEGAQKVAQYIVTPSRIEGLAKYLAEIRRSEATPEEIESFKKVQITEADWEVLRFDTPLIDSDKEIFEWLLWGFRYRRPLSVIKFHDREHSTVFRRLMNLRKETVFRKVAERLTIIMSQAEVENFLDFFKARPVGSVLFCPPVKLYFEINNIS